MAEVTRELLPLPRPPRLVDALAPLFCLPPTTLRSRLRSRSVSVPRHVMMALLRRQGCSLMEIGRILNRDHTSVMHGIRAAEEALDSGKEPWSSAWEVVQQHYELPPRVPLAEPAEAVVLDGKELAAHRNRRDARAAPQQRAES